MNHWAQRQRSIFWKYDQNPAITQGLKTIILMSCSAFCLLSAIHLNMTLTLVKKKENRTTHLFLAKRILLWNFKHVLLLHPTVSRLCVWRFFNIQYGSICHRAEASIPECNTRRLFFLRFSQSIHGILRVFSPNCYATGPKPSLKSKQSNPPQSRRPDRRIDMQDCCQHRGPDSLHLPEATTQRWQHLCPVSPHTQQGRRFEILGWMELIKPTIRPSIHPSNSKPNDAKSIIFKC